MIELKAIFISAVPNRPKFNFAFEETFLIIKKRERRKLTPFSIESTAKEWRYTEP